MRYIGIIILIVLCLILLLLTGCIVNTVNAETVIENIENQKDFNQSSNNFQSSSTGSVQEPTEEPETENSQEWSGLGICLHGVDNLPELYDDVDTLLANGFTQIRIHTPTYTNSNALTLSKTAVLHTVAKGVQVIWGITGGEVPITAANWAAHRQAILDAAQWSQDNGVYEFLLGNEETAHVDGTTMTVAQIIINLKSVATDVQAIFTNGNVSYSCWGAKIDDWITAGKGDIDILPSNLYMGGNGSYDDGWKTLITNLVNAFGVDGTYLTEFGPSWSGLDDYSEDEAVQAAAVTEMIEYIKASGMTRALFFTYRDTSWLSGFGARKSDGTYRLLWNQALLNSGSIKSITVPAKTAKISLPDTIALMPKITR